MMRGMKFPEITGEAKAAAWRHVMPFVVWVVVMSLPLPDHAWRYALQTGAGLAALLAARPWRYYAPPSIRLMPLAVTVGVLVFAVWVLPESPWIKRMGGLCDFYMRYGVRQNGAIAASPSPYAPEQCGWIFSLVRLAGSAFVIAVAEEYFWRGFLLRWMKGHPFTAIPPRQSGWGLLVAGSFIFGMEHSRWLMGGLAGIAYGLLYIRTGDLWTAIVAHVTTNYLLGLYVLATGAYGFW